MIALIMLYRWSLLAAVVMAPALALMGCHLAARDKSIQTLCIGQGATLGVLLGLGTLQVLGAHESWLGIGPLLSAILFSLGTSMLGDWLVSRHPASRTPYFISLFAALLGLGYLVCALFPPLENHMSQVFFGDLATLSNGESFVSIGLGIILLSFLVYWWRPISHQSFQLAIFGESFRRGRRVRLAFSVAALIAIGFSVQFLGFLFTVSCLFLPTCLVVGGLGSGLRRHFICAALLAATASVIGFLLSLHFTRLPTVPLIVVALLVLSWLLVAVRKACAKA